jgi:tetratricopeptide (TPR) repeat protein
MPDTWVGRGVCIEQHSISEPYLPVLDALGALSRGPEGATVVRLLRQYAPTWLVQLPGVCTPAERKTLLRENAGVTPRRMLRELTDAFDALTVIRPVVLFLEDLHWADAATLDWLAFVAARRMPARLLLIGTSRFDAGATHNHDISSIIRELHIHHRCECLALGGLPQQAVAKYVVNQTFLPQESVAFIATAVYERSEGNPLFMTALVEEIVQYAHCDQQKIEPDPIPQQQDLSTALPERLRLFLDGQVDRLSTEDRRLLEAASLIGLRFPASTVAAVLNMDENEVEQRCRALARHYQFLLADGVREWPEGAVSAQYTFRHALYRDVFIDRIPIQQRLRLHQGIAVRLERQYGQHAEEVATELARHFVQGRKPAHAVRYVRLAADTAFRRCAYSDALQLCRQEAELLSRLPATPERAKQELACLIQLGWTLQFTHGGATPEAEPVYDRALALCRQIPEAPELLSAYLGLRSFHQVRGQLATARKLAERCVRLACDHASPTLTLAVHHGLAETLTALGELAAAHEQLTLALNQYAPDKYLPIRAPCLSSDASILWALGYPAQARRNNEAALRLAQQQTNPYTTISVHLTAAALAQSEQRWSVVEAHAAQAMHLADEHGFVDLLSRATAQHGRALVAQGREEQGFVEMRQGCATVRARGANLIHAGLNLLLAGAYASTGRWAEGLHVVEDMLPWVREHKLVLTEAWLLLRQGELLLSKRGSSSRRRKARLE